MDTNGQSLTVHEFAETNPRPSCSEGSLLAHAHRIIQSATLVSGWSWGLRDSTVDLESSNRNAFIYNKNPPSISPGFWTRDKPWGSQLSDGEVYTLEDLDDFVVSAEIHREFYHTTSSLVPSHELTASAKRPRSFDEQPSSKRRKVDCESIFRIIPQPHILHSPYLPSLSDPKGRPFSKTLPTFIPPYTEFSMDGDDRLAWLIPIRGTFPWPHCSTGQLIDFPIQTPLTEGNPVTWTKPTLLGFWDYLLSLRRNAPIGALGIAFHTIRISKAGGTNTSWLPKNGGDSRPQLKPAPHLPATPSDYTLLRPKERHFDRQSLLDIDYIKIYHDASRSFYVRSALDIWVYHPSNEGEATVPTESHRKIRPLKGARLPLVDDICRGVLVS